MPLLKLDPKDPDAERKELEFEVKCTLLKTPEQRLERWYVWNIGMLEWIRKLHGHQESPKIVKRS